MYTRDQMRNGRVGPILEALTKEELIHAMTFLCGWAPDGVAAALNAAERAKGAIGDGDERR